MLRTQLKKLLPVMFLATCSITTSWASQPATVFPVRGVFYNKTDEKAFSQFFLKEFNENGLAKWATEYANDALRATFANRLSVLSKKNSGSSFAVSLHFTRASLYLAPKADGNIELKVPVTASLYFTNVVSGEILQTSTSTQSAVINITKKEYESGSYLNALSDVTKNSVKALIDDLSGKSANAFAPERIEFPIEKIEDGLIAFKAGFKNGFQKGDSLEDEQGNLIRIVYANDSLSFARAVLASGLKKGDKFGKYVLDRKSAGAVRPKATVIIDKTPDSFSSQYLTQLAAEEFAKKTPLSIVQVNPSFSSLVARVTEQTDILAKDTGNRSLPDYLIKLSVQEPSVSKLSTNLTFKEIRLYSARVYAVLTDLSGRVVLTAEGVDEQQIEVIEGLDLDEKARKEIAVKNAVLHLAENLSGLLKPSITRVSIAKVGDKEFYGEEKSGFVSPQTQGFILKKSKNFTPIYDAGVDRWIDQSGPRIIPKLSVGDSSPTVEVGDVFEYVSLGVVPKSSGQFSICQKQESLGSVVFSGFEDVAIQRIGSFMPGVFFDFSVSKPASVLINEGTGFSRNYLKPENTETPYCIQLVQRIDKAPPAPTCSDDCQVEATVRITLRTVKNNELIERNGLQSSIKTRGFSKPTSESSQEALLQTTLQKEVSKLIVELTPKISFK